MRFSCTRPLPVRLALAALVTLSASSGAVAPPKPQPEIRAVWVDAFHAGIRSPQEVDQLVADATRLHLNTIIAQVRRRADALYESRLEPRLDDPAYDPSFDALAYLLRKAHGAGLEVHAWMNAMPVWRNEAPPKDPTHLLNRHGITAKGEDNWLTRSREGQQQFPVGYFLDPGHPAARDHLVSVYLDVVRRYPVDGIHFDYIRYPETEERLPRGSNVGYNPVSIARFARTTGTTAVPLPGDEAFIEWRHEQVTALVRRIAIEAKAVKPRIKISAALIPWGRPPADTADYRNTAPMQRVFQNWPAWLEEGLLDLAVPMNYAREHDPAVREWFNGWIAWEKQHKYGRHLAIGVGGYLSRPEDVLAQVGRVRQPSGRFAADGVSIYSYASPSATPVAPAVVGAAATAPAPGRLEFLATGVQQRAGAFEKQVPVPSMPWLDHPERGFLAGKVVSPAGEGVDGVRLRVAHKRVLGAEVSHVTSDANGWFGAAGLKPGRYRISVDGPGYNGQSQVVEIQVKAGRVSRAAVVAVAR